MADGTRYRLDTVDMALGSGWSLHDDAEGADLFARDGSTVEVSYGADDDVEHAVRRGPNGECETLDRSAIGQLEDVRFWLTGQRPAMGALSPAALLGVLTIRLDSRNPWVPEDFFAAVDDATDRTFLLRILERVHANSQLPPFGNYCHIAFGTSPGGGMFVYPFMRRHPPYKLKFAASGQLMIAGCWSEFPKVKWHHGFAELASLLGLDETGPASAVPVEGLDADEVWEIGERVSREINESR